MDTHINHNRRNRTAPYMIALSDSMLTDLLLSFHKLLIGYAVVSAALVCAGGWARGDCT